MRQRSRAGGKPAKSLRRKAVTSGRRDAPKAVRSLKRHSSKKTSRTRLTPVDQEKFRLKRKLYEALAAQDATGEVLRIISNAKGDLAPIFQAVLENAVRICKAKFGTLYRIDESSGLHLMAQFNTPPEFMRAQRRTIPPPDAR